MLEILHESILNSVLVTGLVIIMMMLIESLNIGGDSKVVRLLTKRRWAQVLLGSTLGVIPGCMGGFAAVSLYTHGLLSFGALVAMMIASSGDESFVMIAMLPDKAPWIFGGLFLLAVAAGFVTDLFVKKPHPHCEVKIDDEKPEDNFLGKRNFSWKRAIMIVGVLVFSFALVMGWLEHAHEGIEEAHEAAHSGVNFLSEEWMYYMFAIFGLVLVVLIGAGSDEYVEHHYWKHIVVHHLPKVFAWTFGALVVIGLLGEIVNIEAWISENVVLMIILAAAIGIIPESGPHLVFVSLFASGSLPLAVLVASCISQDGHAGLPLLAEDKKSFLFAKIINFALAVVAGLLLI